MILTTFLLKTEIKKPIIFLLLSIFAVMTPIGTFIAAYVTELQQYYKEITAIVIGIFLHVSTTILFESNEVHKFNVTKLAGDLLATAIAYII